jgi:hypothetical protein
MDLFQVEKFFPIVAYGYRCYDVFLWSKITLCRSRGKKKEKCETFFKVPAEVVGLNITPTLPEAMVVEAPQLDPEATLLEVSEAAQPQDPEATMVGEDGNAQPPLDDTEAPPPGDFAALPMDVEEEAPELQLQPYEPDEGKKANSLADP